MRIKKQCKAILRTAIKHNDEWESIQFSSRKNTTSWKRKHDSSKKMMTFHLYLYFWKQERFHQCYSDRWHNLIATSTIIDLQWRTLLEAAPGAVTCWGTLISGASKVSGISKGIFAFSLNVISPKWFLLNPKSTSSRSNKSSNTYDSKKGFGASLGNETNTDFTSETVAGTASSVLISSSTFLRSASINCETLRLWSFLSIELFGFGGLGSFGGTEEIGISEVCCSLPKRVHAFFHWQCRHHWSTCSMP